MFGGWQDGSLDQLAHATCRRWVVLRDMEDDGCETIAPTHAKRLAASLSLFSAQPSLGFANDRIHFGHNLIVGNAWTSVVNRSLYLGAKPTVIRLGFFNSGEF